MTKQRGFWDNGPWQDGKWAFEHNGKQYLLRKHHIDKYFVCYIEMNGKPRLINGLELYGEMSRPVECAIPSSPKRWITFRYHQNGYERDKVHSDIHTIIDNI